jgi:hypothetical protein
MKNKMHVSDSLKTVSIHGVSHLFKSKNKLSKWIWFVLSILSIGLSIYFIVNTLIEYFDYNVTTKVRLVTANKFNLPSITICDRNKLSTQDAFTFIQNFNLLDDKLGRLNLIDQQILNLKNIPAFVLFRNLTLNEIKKMSKPIESMIIECIFDLKPCNPSDFEWIYNSRYGNCYRFNSNSTKYVQTPNELHGFSLDLYLDYPIELDKYNIEKGVFVSIDDQIVNVYNDFDDLIDVSTGVETNIFLKRSVFTRYPRPYSNCRFDHARKGFKYYDKIIEAGYSYSQSICLSFCRHEKQGCILPFSSIRIPNRTFCEINDSRNISYAYKKNEYIPIECFEECPLECKTTSFDYTVTTFKYPKYLANGNYEQLIAKGLINANQTEIIGNTLNSVVRLKIYFGSMNYLEYSELPSISIFSLVSNLGGTLGIFLGMSLLSFTEIIEVFFKHLSSMNEIKSNPI